jgi:hypothetical protein
VKERLREGQERKQEKGKHLSLKAEEAKGKKIFEIKKRSK